MASILSVTMTTQLTAVQGATTTTTTQWGSGVGDHMMAVYSWHLLVLDTCGYQYCEASTVCTSSLQDRLLQQQMGRISSMMRNDDEQIKCRNNGSAVPATYSMKQQDFDAGFSPDMLQIC